MTCTGCAEAAALGLARCLPCARELAGRRVELESPLLRELGPSVNDLWTRQQARRRDHAGRRR